MAKKPKTSETETGAKVEPEMQDDPVVEPRVTVFSSSPHPGMNIYRVLKQSYREYLGSGNAANIAVTTPPTHAASAATVVAGAMEWDRSVISFGFGVKVELTQSATVKGSQNTAVDPVTGAYTTSFPGGTLVAGTATATVSCPSPFETTTTPAFTLT